MEFALDQLLTEQNLPCAEEPEKFFGPDNERRAEKERREALAKAICWGCPVIEACLKDSLDEHIPYGVYGGVGEGERQRLLRALPIPRRPAA